MDGSNVDQMIGRDDCNSYIPNFYDLFIPSPVIVSNFCISYDKTDLFIISFLRTFLYMMIYVILEKSIDPNNNPITMGLITTIVWINIIYLMGVIVKQTTFSIGSNQVFGVKKYKETTNQIPYSVNETVGEKSYRLYDPSITPTANQSF
jgi:hypothetical protein